MISKEELDIAYEKCRKEYEWIEQCELAGNDPELQNRCKKLIESLHEIDDAMRRIGVISKNEIVSDINTEDLCFILIHYYVGKLLMKETFVDDPNGTKRFGAVKNARRNLESFLDMCLDLEALHKDDKPLVLAMHATEKRQSSRDAKMGRFRRARDCKVELAELKAKLAKMKSNQDSDESLEREIYTRLIQGSILDSLDDIDSLTMEEEILHHMARNNKTFTSVNSPPAPAPPSEGLTVTRLDTNLNMTRETLRGNVFKQSWLPPTMSLEEYAEIEIAQAKEREQKEIEHRKANPETLSMKQLEAQGLEDDNELADRAAKKDRDWDDYKDENTKGAGVTKRY